MTYMTPELTLVGQASGVILNGIVHPNPRDTSTFADTLAGLEAEW